MPLCQTLSKAPLMSRAIRDTSFPLSNQLDRCWVRMVRISAVLWCGLNPNCLSERRSFPKEVHQKPVVNSCLHNLTRDAEQVKWDDTWMDSTSSQVIVLAVFWLGKTPWLKTSWNSKESGLASSALHSFKTLARMLSGPEALSGCRLCKSLLTFLALKVTLSNIAGCCKWTVCGELICIIKLTLGSKSLTELLSLSFSYGVSMLLIFQHRMSLLVGLPDKVLTVFHHLLLLRLPSESSFLSLSLYFLMANFWRDYILFWLL